LNTRQKFDKNAAAYGLFEDTQNELLDKMNDFIVNMEVHSKKSLLPFQKGYQC